MQIAHTRGHHIFLSNETRGGLASGQAIFPRQPGARRGKAAITSVPVNSETSAVICQKHELFFSLGFRNIFLCQTQELGAAGKACDFPRPGRKQLAALQLWAWISGKTFSRPDCSLSTDRCPRPHGSPNPTAGLWCPALPQMKGLMLGRACRLKVLIAVPNKPFLPLTIQWW